MNRVLRISKPAYGYLVSSFAAAASKRAFIAKRCICVPVRSPANSLPLANRCSPIVVAQRFSEHSASQDSVQERVLKVCREFDKLSAIANKVTLQASFIKDLGLDSLDRIELVMAFEDAFGCEIPDSDAEKLITPADVIKYVQSKQK